MLISNIGGLFVLVFTILNAIVNRVSYVFTVGRFVPEVYTIDYKVKSPSDVEYNSK